MPSIRLYSGTYGKHSRLARWLARNNEKPNCVITGSGAGVTKITIPVSLYGYRPKLSGVTIEAENCLYMEDCGEALIDDLWCNVMGGVGIKIRLGKVKLRGWQQRQHEQNGSRIVSCKFRDVNIIGEGRGWDIASDYDWIGTGAFLNHVVIDGGHTRVSDVAMFMRHVKTSAIYSHHMDCKPHKGLILSDGCHNIRWYGPGHPEAEQPKNTWVIDDPNHALFAIGWTLREPFLRSRHA